MGLQYLERPRPRVRRGVHRIGGGPAVQPHARLRRGQLEREALALHLQHVVVDDVGEHALNLRGRLERHVEVAHGRARQEAVHEHERPGQVHHGQQGDDHAEDDAEHLERLAAALGVRLAHVHRQHGAASERGLARLAAGFRLGVRRDGAHGLGHDSGLAGNRLAGSDLAGSRRIRGRLCRGRRFRRRGMAGRRRIFLRGIAARLRRRGGMARMPGLAVLLIVHVRLSYTRLSRSRYASSLSVALYQEKHVSLVNKTANMARRLHSPQIRHGKSLIFPEPQRPAEGRRRRTAVPPCLTNARGGIE